MDWFILIVGVAAFVGGWYCSSHAAAIEARAAKAITAATTVHTGTVIDSALKTVGQDIDKLIAPDAPAATPAAVSPATVAALASLAKVAT